MSRLSNDTLCADDAPPRAKTTGPILRRRRHRPLHPSTIQDLLRERAAKDRATASPTPFGWLVLLYTKDRRCVRRATRTSATYQDACALRDEEMRWLDQSVEVAYVIRKTRPNQRTIR